MKTERKLTKAIRTMKKRKGDGERKDMKNEKKGQEKKKMEEEEKKRERKRRKRGKGENTDALYHTKAMQRHVTKGRSPKSQTDKKKKKGKRKNE